MSQSIVDLSARSVTMSFRCCVLMLLCAMPLGCAAHQTSPAVRGVDGAMHTPLRAESGDVVVLFFSSPDCPIANAMAPEIERLDRQVRAGGGRFLLVHARRDVTSDVARAHAREFGITAPILLDVDHRLVSELNATVTPEIVVLRGADAGALRCVYQGRINNLYASLGNRRDRATEHYARDAIAAAFDGGEVDPAYRPPLGCFLEKNR